MHCKKVFIKDCWKTKKALKVLKQQLPIKSEYYSSEQFINREVYEKDANIEKINSQLRVLLGKEFNISIYNESSESTSLYLNFYNKISEEKLLAKDFSMFNLSNQIIEEEDEIEELEEKLIPNIQDKKIAKIVEDFYKQEQEEEIREVSEIVKFRVN